MIQGKSFASVSTVLTIINFMNLLILVTEYLPRLFVSEYEYKELCDLIVLRPEWLISVMKVIMELSPSKKILGVESELVSYLDKTGEADLDLLTACWKDRISPPESAPESRIDIHHLCLILQAYCLIYPVPSDSSGSNSDSVPAELGRSKKSKYIIPCKLPEKIDGECLLPGSSTFVFDFERFLPAEIYHRLICLAARKSNPSRGSPNLYSSKKCFFQEFSDTNWIMEMDPDRHRINFSMM